jgi:hypothetical protein
MLTVIEKHDNGTNKLTPLNPSQVSTATRRRADLARAIAYIFQVPHRCVDTALLMRHARDPKAHFNSGKRSHQHQLVEIAEMADSEDFIR